MARGADISSPSGGSGDIGEAMGMASGAAGYGGRGGRGGARGGPDHDGGGADRTRARQAERKRKIALQERAKKKRAFSTLVANKGKTKVRGAPVLKFNPFGDL